jgi:glutamate synthase domain-containing protein 2
VLANMLDAGGEYAFRVRGEEHMWTPDAIAKLQHSTRAGKFDTYKEYAQIINDQSKRHLTLRGLFEFKFDPARRRWTKSNRPRKSSSASPPARCRWARSPPKRTPRWPWP